MKLTAESLGDFLSILPDYDRLSQDERRMLASIERASQACPLSLIRNCLDGMMAAGFLEQPIGNRTFVYPSRHEFIRTLRLFRGQPVLHKPSRETFENYVNVHFTPEERKALGSDSNADRRDRSRLYQTLTSPEWVHKFLCAGDGSWESPYTGGAPALFANREVFSSAQDIVRWLMGHGGRVVLRNLPALAPNPEILNLALYAAIRYALLYVALDPENMDATLGLWPSIAVEATVDCAPPPNVTPAETYAPQFLVDDMTALLVLCATTPIQLKADGWQMYDRSALRLAKNLAALPKWVAEAFYMTCDHRVGIAESFVRGFGLVTAGGYPPKMSVSERGREWIRLPAGDRLQVLMDGLLERKQTRDAFRNIKVQRITMTGLEFHIGTNVRPVPDIPSAVLQVFRSLPVDGFFLFREIAAFGQAANPLLRIYRQDKNLYFSSAGMYVHRPDGEKLMEAWSEMLRNFLRLRMLPMGGIRVGQGPEGLAIAITPLGRYYLGQLQEWQWDQTEVHAEVIVQPNFEVTFLGEAPVAEAELGHFAERRRGQRVGALFQITKKSIFAAAAAGITAERVFEILGRVCTREVPGNVRREIQGWFGQCKTASFESVMIIRCQDRETALRVMGLAKGSTIPLTDTVLEYRDPEGKQRAGLIKKLKEMGVLVSVHEEAKLQKSYW